MKDKTKYLMLYSEAGMSFIMALTSPFIHLYFIKLVSPVIFTISTLLMTIVCALTQTSLKTKERRAIFRKYLPHIMIVDVLLMCIISYFGLKNADIRFIGFGILNSITVVIWFTIMNEAINDTLSSEKLTDFQVIKKTYGSWATAIGGALAVLISYLGIEWINLAVTLQCSGNFIFAICDYKAYKQLEIS